MVVGRQFFPFGSRLFFQDNVLYINIYKYVHIVFGGATVQVWGARVYVVFSHERNLHTVVLKVAIPGKILLFNRIKLLPSTAAGFCLSTLPLRILSAT